MKIYKVVTTPELEGKVKERVHYIAKELGNPIAAKSVWDDYKETRKELKKVAGSLQDPDSVELKIRGLKRINFRSHDFFLLYRIEDETVTVTNVFHFKEDYENKLR